MRNFFRIRNYWPLAAAATLLRLNAQELSLLGGRMGTSDLDQSSYTWQIDYRQIFQPNLAASIAYINEGHVAGHHRDGSAIEAWAQWPIAQFRFTLSAGVGAYYYYDTQALPGGDSLNLHGTSPIFSAAATGYLSNRWFYRVLFNRIHPSSDIKTNTAAIGAGFWFGDERRPTPHHLGNPADVKDYVTDNEFTAFVGQSIVNTLFSEDALAGGAEYRRGLARHIDGTLSYIYEGDPRIVRRSGAAAQLWAVNTFTNERITVGIGLGPYFYIDRKHPRSGSPTRLTTPVGSVTVPFTGANGAAIAPLASLTFSVRLSQNLLARIVWNRVTTSYNRDADVILAGVGVRWPR